jgi:hypothetical protein
LEHQFLILAYEEETPKEKEKIASSVDVTVSIDRYSRECPSNFRRISLISPAVTFLGKIIALSHNH